MRKYISVILLISLLCALTGCLSVDRPLVRDKALPKKKSGTGDSEASQSIAPLPTLPPSMEVDDTGWYVVLRDETALHSEPSMTLASVVTTLRQGETVKLIEEQGKYMHVDYNGRKGWVHSWLLSARNLEVESKRDQKLLAELISRPDYVTLGQTKEMYTTAALLNCREEPSTTATVLCQLNPGDKVRVYGTEGNFYLIKPENGHYCYAASAYFTEEFMYAVLDGAVDLRALLPDAEFDLLFASTRNITGHAMYPAIPLMERTTAGRLYQAYLKFKEDGYTIKVYDAYRPLSAQIELYSIVQDTRFIADPDRGGSWHQHGRAIDMSLIDLETGEEMEMPTAMHTFDVAAARYNSRNWSEEARKNVEYMTKIMESVGFSTITTEWWHYEYLGQGGHMHSNLNFSELSYAPISQFTWP